MSGPTPVSTPPRRGLVRGWVAVAMAAAVALTGALPASGAGSAPELAQAAAVPSISGTVTNGTRPVAGAKVSAISTSGTYHQNFITATDGTYAMTNLPAGTYRVRFDARDLGYVLKYYTDASTLANAATVTVVAGQTTTGINAQLVVGGTVSGVVTDANGPVAGVYVTATEQGTYTGTGAFTGTDGKYTIRGLSGAPHIVLFGGVNTGHVTEYYNDHLYWQDATPVPVVLGSTTGGIDATLAIGGTITGTVTGPGGPAEGVMVEANNGDRYTEYAHTAADGTYSLRGLPAGTAYEIYFNGYSDGLVSEYYDGALSRDTADLVTVTSGATTAGINAALIDGGSIAGVVTGPAGPLSGAYVSAWDPATGASGYATTDASGHYVLEALAPGAFIVGFSALTTTGLRSEYYDNVVSKLTATPVALAASQDRTGINALLADADDPLFSDVPDSAPFNTEIEWLAYMGITSGFPDGTFHPLAPVERQAMAAFLYRFAGKPDFTPPATPSFTDVPVTSPFYTEIEWLASTGITTGWPDGTFRPTASVERQAMAAFLYRFAEEPAFTAPATASFADLPTSSQFFREVEWLAETGITTGWPDGTFRPAARVERQAMAAFLKRFDTWS